MDFFDSSLLITMNKTHQTSETQPQSHVE